MKVFPTSRSLLLLLLAAPVLTVGCDTVESVREYYRDLTPHQAYLLSLQEAGLTNSALGRDWVQASEDAIHQPLMMDAPYEEVGFFPTDEAPATGYRFPVKRGQRMTVTVSLTAPDSGRIFVDLFRVEPDSGRAPTPVLSGEAGEALAYEARRTGDFLLRVQPELLRGGSFRVTILKEPGLAFPVAGRTYRSIGSVFGDPRDAGSRNHHGVDIFAPRGTPVLASAEAVVTDADTTPVGGRVLWLRDSERGASLYYAHMNELLVTRGVHVFPGDTIGRVGNTGNAVTTPPHLHFGLYIRREGPVDPWDFLQELPSDVIPVQVEVSELGRWVRTTGEELDLRDGPSRSYEILAQLPANTTVRVLGGIGTWFRVRLPDGSAGFVSAGLTENANEPLRIAKLSQGGSLKARPLSDAATIQELGEGADVAVLGSFGDFLYVQLPGGRPGWVANGQADPPA